MPSEHNINEEFMALLRRHDPKAWEEFKALLREHDVSCLVKTCGVLQVFTDFLKDYDPIAWGVFIEDERTKNRIRSIVNRVNNSYSQEDLEDIRQIAIVRALDSESRRSRYRGEALPRTWFGIIVHNVAIDYFNEKQRKQEVKFSELSDDLDYIEILLGPIKEPSPEDECLVREVWDAVTGLSLIFQLIIVLSCRHGYTEKEVADRLKEKGVEISEKTVSSYKKRAKDKLKEAFGLYK